MPKHSKQSTSLVTEFKQLSVDEQISLVLSCLSLAWAVGGIVLTVASMFWGYVRLFGLSANTTSLLAFGFGLFMLMSGLTCMRLADRWGDIKKRSHLVQRPNEDTGADLLVLRAFCDDGLRESVGDIFPFVPGPSVPLEEEFLKHFEFHGLRCVALGSGRPHESTLVAERLAVPDEEWRARIIHLMEHSRRVLVIVGNGEGLAWEVRQLRERDRFPDTMFVVPPCEADERARRWNAVLPLLIDGDIVARFGHGERAWIEHFMGFTANVERTLRGASAFAETEVAGLTYEQGEFRAWGTGDLPSELVKRMVQALDKRAVV